MDDLNGKKENKELDLSSLDLSMFREIFAQEDAQREAEQKKEEERLAKIEAEKQAAEKARMEKEILEQERKRREEEKRREEKRLAELKRREEEEARLAAEKAAAAKAAAIKAQEQKAAAVQTDTPVSEEPKAKKFREFSTMLEEIGEQTQNTEPEEISLKEAYKSEDKKSKGKVFSVICVILAAAFLACSALSVFNILKADIPEQDSNETADDTQSLGTGEYAPFASLKANYKPAQYPNGISDEMKAFYSQNKDAVGWLTVDGTAMDYPIVQSKDNKFYLSSHNAYGKSALYGTPFLDYRCNKFDLSKNTIIYGHNMKNNLHFGSIDNYADVSYYKKHPLIHYSTVYKSYTFKIYAVFYATTQADADGGYVFNYIYPHMGTNSFAGYISMLNQYALYTTDAGLQPTDKIITLSTCTHLWDSLRSGGVSTRMVLIGRLLRSGESEQVNTENIKINTNYRRPQIWYDKNGKVNPYAAYRSWAPSSK